MTNYLPTRADQLKPGDVVRDPYGVYGEVEVTDVVDADRGLVEIVADAELSNAGWTSFTVRCDAMIDKRISDEEHKALSAPGVSDE